MSQGYVHQSIFYVFKADVHQLRSGGTSLLFYGTKRRLVGKQQTTFPIFRQFSDDVSVEMQGIISLHWLFSIIKIKLKPYLLCIEYLLCAKVYDVFLPYLTSLIFTRTLQLRTYYTHFANVDEVQKGWVPSPKVEWISGKPRIWKLDDLFRYAMLCSRFTGRIILWNINYPMYSLIRKLQGLSVDSSIPTACSLVNSVTIRALFISAESALFPQIQ